MELVYLWVEKYKNIENQGFNFSPRFTCEYDEKTQELTIDENKEHVSIFPDNINVTAIVGENGSGKSSLAKIILMLIFHKQHSGGKVNFDKAFLIVRKDSTFKKLTINEQYTSLKYEEINTIDFFSIHFNYMLDTLYDNVNDDWVKQVYHRNDGYTTPILLEPYKNSNNEEKIDLKIIEYLNNQRILKFYNNIKSDILINSFFNPNKLKTTYPNIIDWGLKRTLKDNSTTHYNYHYEVQNMTKLSYKIQKVYSSKITRERMGIILESIQNLYDTNNVSDQNKIYLALKLVNRNYLSVKQALTEQIDKIFVDTKNIKAKEVISRIIKEINKIDIDAILPTNDLSYENEKIRRCIDFHNDYQDVDFKNEFKRSLDNTSHISKLSDDFYRFVPPWLEVEFFDNDKSIKSLSSGEKGLFTFIINILYQLSNLVQKEEYKTVNLFLDETDVGFHPEWQKKYLYEIIKSIGEIWKKEVNIVFLTHSPFILSDLPKENVIFLEKGKQVDPNIETFGANIHTLLSHGFFMKDGLMGEFAKEKINEAIKYLNQKTLTEKEIEFCENIISIVGEPILKRQLQRMLDSKRLSKVDKIDLIEKQIKELQDELKKVKK